MVYRVDTVVVGAGAIGLAVARALSYSGREVVVLESESCLGSGTSSRNSEVIHAGLYYPPGTLKAKLCRLGRDALYRYVVEHNVGHRRYGKIVVATHPGELDYLEELQETARANGVEDARLLTTAEVEAMEPSIKACAGLLSPSTGIVDSHGLMTSFQIDAEANGAIFSFNSPVIGGSLNGSSIELKIGGRDPTVLQARLVVNAAGLGSWNVSSSLAGLAYRTIPPMKLAKGSYFTISRRTPFKHLIYPVPEPGGLGIHLTLDLAGQARFGPDVEWIDRVDYEVDPRRGLEFYSAIRKYWPDLPDGALQPGYSGVRPKVTGPGEWNGDFIIQGPTETQHPGYIALYGIESPGLTASLAIGDMVCRLAS